MTDGQSSEPPADLFDAADWLIGRHTWAKHLAERVAGRPLPTDWAERLTVAVNGADEYSTSWADYQRSHPPPERQEEYDDWEACGPSCPFEVQAIGVMSSGEQRLVRLLATLGGRAQWSPQDVGFDRRGAAVLADWMRIIRTQLPESFYPGED